MKKSQYGFALFEPLLLLCTFLIVGFAGWYFFHQRGTLNFSVGKSLQEVNISVSGWKTYHNSCLKLSFRAPPTAKINSVSNNNGNCAPWKTSDKLSPDNPNYWAFDQVNIDSYPSKGSAEQSGAFLVKFSPLLPLSNAGAMKQAGLPAEPNLTETFYSFVADKSRGSTSYTQIAGHQAVSAVLDNPSQMQTSQRTLLIDEDNGNVLQIRYSWPDADNRLQKTSESIISSIKFD